MQPAWPGGDCPVANRLAILADIEHHLFEVDGVLLPARIRGLGGLITRDGGKASKASNICACHRSRCCGG